jgi:hypothetical protein
MRMRIIRCENREYPLRTSQKNVVVDVPKLPLEWTLVVAMVGVIRSKAVDRQSRKNDQQGRPNRNDTLGPNTETPKADLKSMTHGAALH